MRPASRRLNRRNLLEDDSPLNSPRGGVAEGRRLPPLSRPRRQRLPPVEQTVATTPKENFMTEAAIATAPLVAALQPLIVAVVGAVVTGAVSFGVALFSKWTGLQIQASYSDSLRKAAQTEAGVLVAEACDNLSTRSIPVSSPAIATAAAHIETALPEAMTAVGMTPEALCRLVAGEIGKLQAQATTIPIRPSAAATETTRFNTRRGGSSAST
jgi:hypothetical protein